MALRLLLCALLGLASGLAAFKGTLAYAMSSDGSRDSAAPMWWAVMAGVLVVDAAVIGWLRRRSADRTLWGFAAAGAGFALGVALLLFFKL